MTTTKRKSAPLPPGSSDPSSHFSLMPKIPTNSAEHDTSAVITNADDHGAHLKAPHTVQPPRGTLPACATECKKTTTADSINGCNTNQTKRPTSLEQDINLDPDHSHELHCNIQSSIRFVVEANKNLLKLLEAESRRESKANDAKSVVNRLNHRCPSGLPLKVMTPDENPDLHPYDPNDKLAETGGKLPWTPGALSPLQLPGHDLPPTSLPECLKEQLSGNGVSTSGFNTERKMGSKTLKAVEQVSDAHGVTLGAPSAVLEKAVGQGGGDFKLKQPVQTGEANKQDSGCDSANNDNDKEVRNVTDDPKDVAAELIDQNGLFWKLVAIVGLGLLGLIVLQDLLILGRDNGWLLSTHVSGDCGKNWKKVGVFWVVMFCLLSYGVGFELGMASITVSLRRKPEVVLKVLSMGFGRVQEVAAASSSTSNSRIPVQMHVRAYPDV